MEQRGSLYTLEEWAIEVDRGTVKDPPYTPDVPSTGIECPNDLSCCGRPCRAHLWDLPFVTKKHGVLYKAVGCSVCGWSGFRRVAESKLKVIK